MNKGVPKIEGQSQCTGEAEYVGDIAPAKGEVHAAFVTTTLANCDLDVVDPADALVQIVFSLSVCLSVNPSLSLCQSYDLRL